jgi:mono/diheme cytochrome c family protein
MRREWGVIVAGLALVAMTACGGGNKEEAVTSDTTAVPPAAAPAPAPPTAGTPPAGATPEMVAAGQQTFAGTCAACHGPDGKGLPNLGANLTDSEWLDTDGTWAGIEKTVKTGVPQPKQGQTPMPPMGGAQLTDDQIKAVAAYVWSLGGGK